mgnify:CR=1 FL=1
MACHSRRAPQARKRAVLSSQLPACRGLGAGVEPRAASRERESLEWIWEDKALVQTPWQDSSADEADSHI